MSIKIADPNNEGQEIEVFTSEEMASHVTEKLTPLQEEAKKAREEADNYKRVAAEQTQNFKKLNEMSADEKAQLTASQIEAIKRAEKAEADIAEIKNQSAEETKKRVAKDTEDALFKYHGGDAKLKEEIEKMFKLVAMPGDDTATIQERARLASSMYNGSTGRANPLTQPMNGGSPAHIEKSKKEEFFASDKAKEAERRMGGAV